ncbi:putative polysaccharide lyase, PLnc family [Polaribacter sp. Hel1_85]|nr:putative polysaccharide lyase, PLnc family [Polaribacter sp. Hel1_85]
MIVFGLGNAQSKQQIGASNFSDWSGVTKVKKGEAVITNGSEINYTYSNQNRVYFPGIKRPYNGDAADFTPYKGLVFDLFVKKQTTVEVKAVLKVDHKDVKDLNPVSTATVKLTGKGWQKVFIPWEMFDVDKGQIMGTLYAVKNVSISAVSNENKSYKIKNIFLTKGLTHYVNAEIRGKTANAGEEVVYHLEVGNTTNIIQSVQLRVETMGWESMKASLGTTTLQLAPNETKRVNLNVAIAAHLPTGIREKQVVKAIANGQGASVTSIEFTTAVRVPTPNIIFTEDKWDEVKDKINKYDWAKEGLAEYERKAKKFNPSNGVDFSKIKGSLLGKKTISSIGHAEYDCAIAYKLTGNEAYAAKCLKVLRRISDPKVGYRATLVGGSNSFVGEGKFWQGMGRVYDLIRESKLLTEEDHQAIQDTFRLFVNQTIKGNRKGAISNWNAAELTAALYCALNLQDWYLIDQLLNAPTGLYKHIEHGIMNDGWWYECAVGYNTWVATELSETAIALQPWGINLKDRTFPIGTTKHFSLLASRREGGIMGMEFEKWGKIEKNSVQIKDMWDASIPFMDFRGVLLAVNDAVEDKMSGKAYELAYYLYKDPEYAAIINRGAKRDLLYGVPDLPKVDSEKMTKSVYADNMGIVQMRSQTKGRKQSEQIQAAMHYGSHGGYHGHFDRTNLVHMSRYGRSFYGTLMFWYGYGSYLYKFWKQSSINKNMVVVDQKMQQPVQNSRLLFHSGNMMQATAIETNSKWSHPPYGGIPNSKQTFAEKMWSEGRTIPLPENQPEFGEVTEFTEPVLQRRLMVVLDDYIVMSDYLKGEKEHEFDWMFQAKGFKRITSDKTSFKKHTNQMDTNPVGSAQFVTDCNWYDVEGTSRTQFEMCWGEGCDNKGLRLPHSLDGALKIDVFNAWPKKAEVMIGTSTEGFYVNKKLWYAVLVDDTIVHKDSTGAWILGSKKISVDVSGKKKLELTTKIADKARNNTIFWGDAKLILKDGSQVYLSSLPVKYENVLVPENKGKDYYGGPIKIGGEPMSNSTPGMPVSKNKVGKITIDLSGLDVDRFEAKIGGDFPLGDETSRLKSMAVRTKGKKGRYLSVVEPYENKSLVKSVEAKNENELTVTLTDGRVQKIKIEHLESTSETVKVTVKEYKEGKLIREEVSNHK